MALIINLATHRRAAGLTQAALAQATGVSRKTINTVENGVFIPSTHLALKLAQTLGTSVHDLFELPPEDRSKTP
jgi:putative transcriptional regulator